MLHIRYRQHSDWRRSQGETHDSEKMVSEKWLPQYWDKVKEAGTPLELRAYEGPEEDYPPKMDWTEWEDAHSKGARGPWVSMYRQYASIPLPPDHQRPGEAPEASTAGPASAPAASSGHRSASRSLSRANKIPKKSDDK